MAVIQGGFDNVFVKKLSERFTCPICHLALKEPRLTECGHHFCASCLTECLGRGYDCPVCRTELESSKIFPNNALKREILNLKIRCNRKKKGCEWVGELRMTEDHDQQCWYVDEECDKCGHLVTRKSMKNHKKKHCPRRKTKCEHCHSIIEWKELQDHYKKCSQYPVMCMCTYCGEMFVLSEVADHVGDQGTCPNSLLDCKFKAIGCGFRGNRREMAVHIKDDTDNHFSLMATELVTTKQELEETKSKLAMVVSCRGFYLPANPPDLFVHTWKIENWSQKVLEAKGGIKEFIATNPFYVPPGYHLYLRAYADELFDDVSHLGVFLFATEGDFDGSIKWPLPFSFTVEIVDQQPDGKNSSAKWSPPYVGALEDPATVSEVVGFGPVELVSHDTLWRRCYIKDDAIIIKLTVHALRYPCVQSDSC